MCVSAGAEILVKYRRVDGYRRRSSRNKVVFTFAPIYINYCIIIIIFYHPANSFHSFFVIRYQRCTMTDTGIIIYIYIMLCYICIHVSYALAYKDVSFYVYKIYIILFAGGLDDVFRAPVEWAGAWRDGRTGRNQLLSIAGEKTPRSKGRYRWKWGWWDRRRHRRRR